MHRPAHAIVLLLCAGLSATLSGQGGPRPIRFTVSLGTALGSQPVSGRLIVLMTNNAKPVDVIEPGLADTAEGVWIAAREVRGLGPGDTIELDPDDLASPGPLSLAPHGDYQVMALLDVDHNAAYTTLSPGDLRSPVMPLHSLDPRQAGAVPIALTTRIGEPPTTLAPGQDWIDFVSPSLSAFWGRPIHMRSLVITPAGYSESKERYPVAYITGGFGATVGDMVGFAALIGGETAAGKLPPMIWVALDESCAFGTHEFADSVSNGPWGHALTRELIPHLEGRYRMDARPSGRLLNGHSSGGWATMWLQIQYPDVFGGTWSTSPDPLDFHHFGTVDLTTATNLYHRADGAANPVARMNGTVETIETEVRRESVLGEYGGQWTSFEAVFSPRGPDGRPQPMFDRRSGEIDRQIAERWLARYDLSHLLVLEARQRHQALRGRLHVIVGTADTFYLDTAVRGLQEAIAPLGYDARFTYLEGRDHFNLYDGDLLAHIAGQMYAVARPGTAWKPTSALNPSVRLVE